MDYVAKIFYEWQMLNDGSTIFNIDLSLSKMKPNMSNFVQGGISRLRTLAMKETIAESFQKEGCINEAMKP